MRRQEMSSRGSRPTAAPMARCGPSVRKNAARFRLSVGNCRLSDDGFINRWSWSADEQVPALPKPASTCFSRSPAKNSSAYAIEEVDY
ncbi:hypothetical protein DSL92_03275 [Billgrantia gudaonensis]|uniref:Uncharacterized protein n=1 Tax=Billgrantia gudaonensis TaxID=376427 RepID=A0A3S0QG41_9GAMM|nr:hypothetical protein DSL92_03275 [Halomonas gudaonensis]